MKKNILKILSTVFIVFIAINNVYANEIASADNEVLEEGEYDNLRLIAGNKVKSKATIDGISFAAGNDVELEGNYIYGFYAGNNVTINGTVEKDVFIAGNNINIGSDAIISRDAYIAGNSIKINANIGRDLRVGAMTVELSGITINGDVYIDAEEIILDDNTVITGKLSYLNDTRIRGIENSTIGSIETRTLPDTSIKIELKDRVYSLIVSAVANFIVMIILFYLLPNTKNKLAKTDLDFITIAKKSGIGLLLLLLVPIACIIAMFTGVLTPLAIITIVLFSIAFYISKLLVAYIVGNQICTKLFKTDNTYYDIAIGIIVLGLIILIPILGNYINFISIIYGLGLIYNYLKTRE